MVSVSLEVMDQIAIGVASVVVPSVVTALSGLILVEITKIFPALSGLITAQRIKSGEDAISNMVMSDLSKSLPTQANVSVAVAARVNEASASLTAAMAKQGTTVEQMSARVTGSVVSKLTSQTTLPLPPSH